MENSTIISESSAQIEMNQVTEVSITKKEGVPPSAEPGTIVSEDKDEYTDTLDRIEKLYNLYNNENASLLEVIQQYDMLIDQISYLRNKLDVLTTDEIQANELYDSLKKNFADEIERTNWGEKLYYALPLYEDFDDTDDWILQWCKVMEQAVGANKENIRIFINKNFYNNVFSLPNGVYYYKANVNELNNVTTRVKDIVYTFSTKTLIFFKFLKDFSESLRSTLVKVVSVDGDFIFSDAKKVELPKRDKLVDDNKYINGLRAESKELKQEIIDEYARLISSDIMENIMGNPELFISDARKLYQQVQDYQNRLNSLSRRVYTDSLIDLYKLYDTIGKSLSDFRKIDKELPDTDEESKLCCLKFITMMEKLIEVITKYLKESYNIEPLKIELYKNFNEYDVNWYDVLVAEDAPSKDLVECISAITDSGFAKYNVDGIIEFVTRPAKISVYNKKVVDSNIEDSPVL